MSKTFFKHAQHSFETGPVLLFHYCYSLLTRFPHMSLDHILSKNLCAFLPQAFTGIVMHEWWQHTQEKTKTVWCISVFFNCGIQGFCRTAGAQ